MGLMADQKLKYFSSKIESRMFQKNLPKDDIQLMAFSYLAN